MKIQHGFTLLEVMVALSICALTGLAAMQINSEHINNLSALQEQTYASWVAENRLVELNVGKKVENNKEGEQEQAGIKWYWRQKATPTKDPEFVELKITIFTDSAMQNEVYELNTFIALGAW